MKIGDLIMRKSARENHMFHEQIGIVVMKESDHRHSRKNPQDMDYVVLWGRHGLGWEYSARCKVIHEAR